MSKKGLITRSFFYTFITIKTIMNFGSIIVIGQTKKGDADMENIVMTVKTMALI